MRARNRNRLLGVEQQQQLVFQLVNSTKKLPPPRLQRFRGILKRLFLHLDHIADLVDQQTDGTVIAAYHHIHGKPARIPCRQFQLPAQVDGGDDLPAQVNQPGDDLRRQRNACHLLIADDLLHLFHLDPEEQVLQKKRAQLPTPVHACAPSSPSSCCSCKRAGTSSRSVTRC